MKRVALLMGILAGLLLQMGFKAPTPTSNLVLQTIEAPTATIYFVRAPMSHFRVVPVVSPQLNLLPQLVGKLTSIPVAAINAGFFDPANHETTSFITIDGKLAADPKQNKRLVQNPALKPYLQDMLNRRSELRIMRCQDKIIYDIAEHQAPIENHCELLDSLQAGPDLLNPNALEEEAFIAKKGETIIRDPLGVGRRNARSAIGIDFSDNILFVMAAMKPLTDETGGVTLKDMKDTLKRLGAKKALSLDGGSSATLWFKNTTYYGKLDKSLKPVKRPIKSALVIVEGET